MPSLFLRVCVCVFGLRFKHEHLSIVRRLALGLSRSQQPTSFSLFFHRISLELFSFGCWLAISTFLLRNSLGKPNSNVSTQPNHVFVLSLLFILLLRYSVDFALFPLHHCEKDEMGMEFSCKAPFNVNLLHR